MDLLNPATGKPSIKFCMGETKSRLFEVRGKKFLYDGNSMDVFQVEDEDEASKIELFKGVPQFPYFGSKFTRALVFEASHFCNIRCTYCFVDKFYKDKMTHMSLDTAIEAFNRLVDVAGCRQAGSFQAGFFGGEPLVNWDMIKKLVPYVNGVMNPVKVNWGVTTNAILMTEEIAKFMIHHGFSSIVSVDGPKDLHNRCRVYKDGRGSFDDVMNGLDILNSTGYNRSTFRSTYLPAETKILNRVKFLNDLCDEGKGNWVSVEPACLTESRCVANLPDGMVFNLESVRALEDEYLECADWFIDRVKAGKKPRFHNLYKPVERLLYHVHSPSECGAGSGYISVNPLGEIYACHREINSQIGSMSTGGMDERERAKWLDNRSYLSRKCNKCAMQWHCGGGCREAALGSTKNIHVPDPIGCTFRDLFFKAALWIISHCDRKQLMEQVPDPRRMKSAQGKPQKQRPTKQIVSGCDCSDKKCGDK